MSAVCEAARNVACTGARPAAVTNCLNFGNPETAEVGYELAEAIEGMALACEALGLPVVSGNVSLYNEHHGRPIHPTPVVGVVGVLDDASLAVGAAFREEGDVVLCAGDGPAAIDGSVYQRVIDGTPTVESRSPTSTGSAACTSCSPPPPSAACFRARTTCPTAASRSRSPSRHVRIDRRGRAGPPASRSRGRRAGGRFGAPRAPRRARAAGRRPAAAADRHRRRRAHRGRPAPRSASPRRPRSTRGAPARARRGCRLMCGVFGIYDPPGDHDRDVARLTYFGLYALQHRGQESAGIAVSRRLAGDGDEGHGPREPGVRRAAPVGALRPYRDRPRPLLDDGIDGVAERPADRAPFEPRGNRARPQRQPDQHVVPPRRPPRAARAPRVDVRHRGDRRADRPAPVRRPGRRRGRHHVARRGGIRRGRPLGAGPGRVPRPRRHPPAGRRAPRRRLGAGIRDMRARPHRRPPRARAPARASSWSSTSRAPASVRP